MELRRIILSICLVLIGGLAFSQDKEPDINDFIFADQEPKPLNMAEVRKAIGYPEEAIAKNVEGTVVVRVLVDKEGKYVKHTIVKKLYPPLAEAVEAQVSKLTFSPAMLNGEPIMFWVNIPFAFKLLNDEDVIRQNIEKLTDDLSGDPENHEIWHKRGIQRSQLKEYEDALADFNESLRLNPRKNKKKATKNSYSYLFYSHYGRGTVYFNLERYEDAIADFTQALTFAEEMKIEDADLKATVPTLYLERGYTYAQVEKYAESKADFKKTIELDPEQKCNVYPLLVDIGLAEDNAEELVEYYDGMVNCEPDEELNYFSRGYYKSETGDYAGAIKDLETAAEKTENVNIRTAAVSGIGIAHMRAGDFDQAKAKFMEAVSINVLNPMPYYHLGQLGEKMEDETLACENYKKALTFDIEGAERETAIAYMKASCGGWDDE
ncbi:MAG: TonB family protein [Bacteroidetes bacterium]|nr:TonB family protein [Bacteroidota bacterium]MCB0847078.1 TonB family protein [Bacteroidota bacterium]